MAAPVVAPPPPPDALRRRAVVLGVLSLVIAAGTAAAVWGLVSGYQTSVAGALQVGDGPDVVFAVRRLAPGTVIAAADLTVARGPTVTVDGMVHRVEDVVGKTVADVVLPGEALRAERLAEGGGELTLDELVPDGHRAVTILASRAGAVGGRLRPGSRVDVILTIRPERNALSADWVADTILQDVRVIGVGDRIGTVATDDDAPSPAEAGREVYVTLDLEPEQGERLALGASRGQLVLALRSPGDAAVVPMGTPVVTNALLGIAPARRAAAAPPPPDGTTTEVILGTNVKVESFDDQGRHVGTGRPPAHRP